MLAVAKPDVGPMARHRGPGQAPVHPGLAGACPGPVFERRRLDPAFRLTAQRIVAVCAPGAAELITVLAGCAAALAQLVPA